MIGRSLRVQAGGARVRHPGAALVLERGKVPTWCTRACSQKTAIVSARFSLPGSVPGRDNRLATAAFSREGPDRDYW
jgi:hypothetical protein